MRRVLMAGAILLTAFLASCGGGSSTQASNGGVGTGGTGISFGTVTGFGSVVLDGTAYSSASPQYLGGTDQDESAVTTSTAVELGDQLRVDLDAQGKPATVVVEPELIGPLANLQAASGGTTFSVNGMAVRINTVAASGPLTYYAGLGGAADLADGMQVEVHGVYGVDAAGQGYIQATLVEQLQTANPVTRITGAVANLDPAAGSFRIGGMTVTYGAAARILPAGAALADGQLVNVWTNAPRNGSSITAGVIRIRTLAAASGPVQIAGLVSQISGAHFVLSGIAVDASAASLASITQGLALGDYVTVQGQASGGTVLASAIRASATQHSVAELRGTITGYVSASKFLVRGVTVDASHAQFANGASVADLADGVYADVVGSIGGNIVTAATISIRSSVPDGATGDFKGQVSGYDATARSFLLTQANGSSLNVTLASNVAYRNGSAATLANGVNVEIEATSSSSGLSAYSVSFKDTSVTSGGVSDEETSGLAYNVAYASGGVTLASFAVNGIAIQVDGSTSISGTVNNGVRIDVTFRTLAGGQHLATEVSVEH